MTQNNLLKFPLSIGKYSSFIDNILRLARQKKFSMVCVANVHMFIEAHNDESFLRIVNNADLVTPDGRPLIWALQILKGVRQDRVTGMDLLPNLLKRMSKENIAVFFYGSTESMLEKTKTHIEMVYPGLRIAGFHSPPFGPLYNQEENGIVAKINDASPCVVFVVLGCPKQEKWMASMKGKINAVMVGIGGALPVLLGIQKRAPVWMQDYGLEWLYRLYQEPRRLFKRYSRTNSLFLLIFVKEFLKIKLLEPLSLYLLPGIKRGLQFGQPKKSIVILGHSPVSNLLNRYLENDRSKFQIAGIFADNIHELTSYPVLGGVKDFLDYANIHRIDAIYSLVSENTSGYISDIVRVSKKRFIKFNYVRLFGYEKNIRQDGQYSPKKLHIESTNYPLEKKFYLLLKRTSDIIISLFGIIFILSWIIPLVGLLIRITSRGPVFYYQKRSGLRNRIFNCIKFRTCCLNRQAGEKQDVKVESKVTPFGKFLRKTHIDGLPQLFNVLVGQMSLVGPWPQLIKHSLEFAEIEDEFILGQWLKPGLTGWAPINGYRALANSGNQISQNENDDLWYIENWSLLLDLKIMFRTFMLFIKGDKIAF